MISSDISLDAFFSYAAFLLLLFPTMMYALLPLKENLKFFDGKRHFISILGCTLIIFAMSLLGCVTGFEAKLIFAIALLPLFGVFQFLSSGDTVKKLYTFLNSTMVITNSIVFGTLLSAPQELNNEGTILLPQSSFICLGVALVSGLIYWKTLAVKIPYLIRSDALDLDYRFAVIIPLVVSLFFYWATPKSAAVVMTGRVRSTTLTFLCMVPLAVLLIYHVFWRIAANLVENANLRQENELLGMQRKRYEELRTYMNETSALRHDFRQHLLAIQGYARNGETEKLSDYIASFSASLADHRGSFSANAAVDAVASHYDELAKLQKTEISWLLGLPETLPLPESDFITVFGNLVENALNAVKDLPEGKRNINVTVKMLSDAMLGITVKNPYEGVIKLNKNGLPKSGRPGHGIGFSSVEAVVHRYNGALEIDTSNGLFTVGALLYV
ncbi:MAG: GHKL domain-containing protein [Firmicutes bacterium]|nr:GHKL domain-containing protein [Bacillota bacterium]